MKTSRRDFIAKSGAAAAAMHDLAHAQAPNQGHDHEHEHSLVPSDPALRVKSLESLLVEKGLVDPAALDALVDTYEHKIGPRNGARVVARAWVDSGFKQRLLADGTAAIAELGFGGRGGDYIGGGEHAQRPQPRRLHFVFLLSVGGVGAAAGLVQVGGISIARRHRSARRAARIWTGTAEEVEVRVWDSTAELRYLVLPERPAGTEKLSEEELAALVTRDAMIGVAKVPAPKPGGRA